MLSVPTGIVSVISLAFLVTAVPPLQYETPKAYRRPFPFNSGEHINNLLNPRYRLPTNLIPLSYNLTIQPILDEFPEIGERFTAPAAATIRVRCDEPTSIITLHSLLLTINHSSITVTDVQSGMAVEVSSEVIYDEEMHFYNITVNSRLVNESLYDIYIEYIAPVSQDRTSGLYLTSYVDPDTETIRYQAVTQLEPARGRQIFPSFDEPGFKTTYSVRIGRLSNYISLSNAPLRNTEPIVGREGWFWDIFETTAVKLPTYLFALAVCDFTFEETNIFRLPVKSYGPKHWIDERAGVYSAETTAKILTFFEERYNATYDMPKMDSIAVPGKGGAMENWGLITYGDWLMYFDNVTTESERWSLDSVLAHELAHQWFGNLVTCQTWSHIWLNEGITTYVSYIGVDEVSPEFEPRKYIVNDAHQNALIYDASDLSHPMIHNANTTAEISMFFSSIVYDKGASIVRMMEGFLTEPTLHAGLRNYLQRKAHGNAVQDELFEELTKQAHADGTLSNDITVKDIMDTWTLKKGFPLVGVSRGPGNTIYLSQETFRNANIQDKQDPYELWAIPISYATQSNPNFTDHTPKFWIEKTIELKTVEHNINEWIVVNTDSTGFYRVLYDNYFTTLIQIQLQEDYSTISALSRSQLIDDYFNLAFQDYIMIETALPFLNNLDKETDFVVWNAVVKALRQTFWLFSGTSGLNGFRSFISPRLEGALEKIGLEQLPDDKGALVMLRTQLLDWACALESSICMQYASRLFSEWQSHPGNNHIPIGVQQIVYCTGVAAGGEIAFEFALNQYKTESSLIQKSRLLNALTCTKDPALIDTLLELSLDQNSGILKSDAASLISLATGNSIARPIVLNFLRRRTIDIVTFFDSANVIAQTAQYLSYYYGSQPELDDLTAYIDENSDILQGIQDALMTSVATIRNNILWMNKFFVPMKTWFESSDYLLLL